MMTVEQFIEQYGVRLDKYIDEEGIEWLKVYDLFTEQYLPFEFGTDMIVYQRIYNEE